MLSQISQEITIAMHMQVRSTTYNGCDAVCYEFLAKQDNKPIVASVDIALLMTTLALQQTNDGSLINHRLLITYAH